jgi:hypothetical protein
MEKLICPQCGGNDLNPFGSFAYKCESCGTVLKPDAKEKAEPVIPPPLPKAKTHYVAPVSSFDYEDDNVFNTDGSTMDNPDTRVTKIIFGIVVVILGIIVLVWSLTSPSKKQNTHADIDEMIKKIQIPQDTSFYDILNDIPSFDPATYEAKGITIKNVSLASEGIFTTGTDLHRDQHFIISLLKPKGFTKEEKKFFIGIAIAVKDKDGKVMFSSDDINKTNGDKGEDYLRYKEKCDISLIISDSFGFSRKGNYVIEYRVWDKKSSKEIAGKVPVFVAL